MKSNSLVVAAAAMMLTGHAASPPLSEHANLSEVLAYAGENNASLHAANSRWEAAVQKIPQARGWPDPRLNYGYFVESVETRVGPQLQRIGVMQPVPWFGKLKAAGDVAGAEAAGALAELGATQLQVVREIKDAWYELAWLEEARRITRENIELVAQLEAVAQTRLKAGGDLGAVTKAQVELGKLQDRLESLEDMRVPMQARLNALLSRPNDAPLPPTGPLPTDDIVLPAAAELRTWQVEASPILEQLSQKIVREEHAIRYARKLGMPEFGVGFDYIVTGEAVMPGVPDSGKDAAVAMLTLNIPIGRSKYKAAVAEAEARRDAAESTREYQTQQLAARLNMALYRFRDAERKRTLFGATLLPQAQSALTIARQNYESGKSDFLNLIDSQRALLEFELEHRRALANREQALAEIEMLVGRDVTHVAPVPANK